MASVKRLVLIIKLCTSWNKAQLISLFTDSTPYNKKFSFLATLLDYHVSPRILAAEVRRTLSWAAYLGQYKKKCFNDSESKLHSQISDTTTIYFDEMFCWTIKPKSKAGVINRCTPRKRTIILPIVSMRKESWPSFRFKSGKRYRVSDI